MKPLGILFLGGAKRVSMARLFKEAGRKREYNVAIYSYEISERQPIACEATVVVGKRWSDPATVGDIITLCREKGIGIVIPFVDGAVSIAAQVALHSNGEIFAPTGSPEDASRMFDKCSAAQAFENAGLPIPENFSPGKKLRWIAKPRNGSASKGILFPANDSDAAFLAESGDYLVQEFIKNATEYTVDCYAAVADGRIMTISQRQRLETVGGEVSRTITVADSVILNLSQQLIEGLYLRGAITIQFIRDNVTGRTMVMEVNPRLGGGAVCSVYAGADLPGLILDNALGTLPSQAPEPRPGVEMCRYMQEVIFE